ncbi:MAG: guanylate cyclase [Myxococcaceae bacterium]|nr:guanylate cyclase [Myxococcaceae bacterium]
MPGVVLGPARVVPDFDGEVRDFPHLVATEIDGRLAVLASAPLLAVMRLTQQTKLRWFSGSLFIGDRLTVPMGEDGRTVLAWDAPEVGTGGRGTMKRAVPVWRLLLNLEDDENKRGVRHHDNELSGRVVVLSETGGQRVSTAIGRLPRGAVMGQALVNLLHSRSVTRTDPQVDFWITIAFAFGGALVAVAFASLFPRSGWIGYVLFLAVLAVAVGWSARAIFLSQLRWVPVVAPVLAGSLTFLASLGYARTLERSLRDFVTHALGRALPAQVLGSVESDVGLMKPERLQIAVYFSDIEGFTALAQRIEPKVLVDMLQQYLSEMTEVVIECRGQVDKYLGDGVMAFWGAPVRLPSPAKSACDAALKMRARFDKRRKVWEKISGTTMVFRSGLDVGETLVGEMGTEHRLNYTVMGESVATAAKLEALSKKYGAVILCTEAIATAAGDAFVFREVDQVRFHRRDAPVRVFELLGDLRSHANGTGAMLKWQAALELYRGRKFAEARIAFALFAGATDDALAQRYIKRCEMLQAVPPPETWDGVFDGPE